MIAVEEIKISQHDLLKVIHQELIDLPPLPAVVLQVMQTINDPKTSAADLNKMISMEPALSAKILRLVNSAHYGFGAYVSTITHAIVILGFECVRNLVTALGVASQFKPNGRHLLDRNQFWAHSAATALAADVIARRRKLNPKACEEVFVGGLLHDIGKLFLDQYFAKQYNIAVQLASAGQVGILRAEVTALGLDHASVGKRIAEKWRLPPTPISMIALHHEPRTATEYFEYAATVHAADIVVKQLNLGSSGDNIVPILDAKVERWLSFTPQIWELVHAETLEKFAKANEFVSVLTG